MPKIDFCHRLPDFCIFYKNSGCFLRESCKKCNFFPEIPEFFAKNHYFFLQIIDFCKNFFAKI